MTKVQGHYPVAPDGVVHDAAQMTSEQAPVRIIVQIDRAEPFRGTIAEREQPLQTFNGWTAFAAAMAVVVRRIGAAGGPGDRHDGTSG